MEQILIDEITKVFLFKTLDVMADHRKAMLEVPDEDVATMVRYGDALELMVREMMENPITRKLQLHVFMTIFGALKAFSNPKFLAVLVKVIDSMLSAQEIEVIEVGGDNPTMSIGVEEKTKH